MGCGGRLQIVTNCGEEPSVVLNKVKEGKDSFGYNAATGEYGDMLAMGILDPTKVTRTNRKRKTESGTPTLSQTHTCIHA